MVDLFISNSCYVLTRNITNPGNCLLYYLLFLPPVYLFFSYSFNRLTLLFERRKKKGTHPFFLFLSRLAGHSWSFHKQMYIFILSKCYIQILFSVAYPSFPDRSLHFSCLYRVSISRIIEAFRCYRSERLLLQAFLTSCIELKRIPCSNSFFIMPFTRSAMALSFGIAILCHAGKNPLCRNMAI